jgi:hypothetical protein
VCSQKVFDSVYENCSRQFLLKLFTLFMGSMKTISYSQSVSRLNPRIRQEAEYDMVSPMKRAAAKTTTASTRTTATTTTRPSNSKTF